MDFRLKAGDDALVVAESLGTLAPLRVSKTAPAQGQPAADVALAGQSAR